MDLRSFVPALSKYAGIEDQDLLEKDIRLHLLLSEVADDPDLYENLVFKGGTCLIKCYLDYPRFSIDLDFTWRNQANWGVLTGKKARESIGGVRRRAVKSIASHAGKLGMEMPKTGGLTYGRSGQMMTMLLNYESASEIPETTKVQVNFVEPLLYDVVAKDAASLLHGVIPEELRFLEPDLSARYASPVVCLAYDPREILTEKCRAILTREAVKARDVLDLYLIEKNLGLRVEDYIEAVRRKVQFSVDRTDRYRKQIGTRGSRFKALLQEDVKPILLKPIDENQFRAYKDRILGFLELEGTTLEAR